MCHQFMRHDTDEAGRQPTLRHKGLRGARAQDLDLIRHFNIFSEVEVVQMMGQGQTGNRGIAIVGKARENGVTGIR